MPQSLPQTQPRCHSLARRPADPSDRFVSPIARRLRRGLFSALLCLPLLAMFATGVQAQTSTISLSLDSSSGNEGNSDHSDVDVTISVSPHPSVTSVFDFCVKNTGTATFRTTSGGKTRDFDIVTGSSGAKLTMTPQNCHNFTFHSRGGSDNQRVKLRIFGDTTPEENETVILELRNPYNVVVSPTAGTATYTINNDDVTTSTTPTVTIAGGSAVTEGTGAQFTVNASPAPTGALTVQLDVSDDDTSDFVAAGDEGRKTVTIGASQTSATYTVNTVADSTDEPNGEVTVSVAESDSYTVGSTSSATTTVNDDDADTTAPQVSSITRQTPSTRSTDADSLTWRVTFDEPVQNVDAAAFQVSGTTASITGVSQVSGMNAYDVTASGGDLENLNATVTLRFASNHNVQDTSGNALAANPTPTGTNHNSFTVSNTVVSPTITITGGSAVTEGTRAQFTVSASPVPTGELIVYLSITQNGDVIAVEPGLRAVIIDTSGSATQNVPTQNDFIDEANGSVTVTVNARTGYTVGSPSSATITVNDNDTRGLVLNPASLSVGEGDSANYTVKLATRPTAAVTVTVGGTGSGITVDTDSGSSGDQTMLTFNPETSPLWSTAQTVRISAEQDSNTVNESVTLTHTTSGGDYGANSVSKNLTVTATEKPAASFASGSSSAAEDAGTHNVTVNLSQAAPSGGLTLSYNVTGTATAGSGNDFTIQGSGTLSVAAGATTATIPVVILDDSTDEPAETVILTLTGDTGYTLGSTTVHTLTITDNDDPVASFASASSSAAEDAGTHNVTVNLTSAAPSGGLTLRYSITGTATVGSGNDFTIQNSGTRSVTAGAASATIPVVINDDSTDEPAETVILTLTTGTGYTLGTPRAYTLTITDNDDPPPGTPALEISKNTLSISEGGTDSYTVRLATEPTSTVTVNIASNNADVTVDPSSLTFNASGNSNRWSNPQTVTVSAAQDDDANNDSATLTHTASGGGYGSVTDSVTVTVDDDETPPVPTVSFSASAYSVSEGDAVSVTLNIRPVRNSATEVGITYTNGTAGNADYSKSPVSLIIPANAGTHIFTIQTTEDQDVESNETFTLALDTVPAGVNTDSPSSVTITITDDETDTTDPPGPRNGNDDEEGEDDPDGQNQDPTPATSVVAFAADTSRPSEDAGTADVTVTLTPAPAAALTVHYTVTGTATAGRDFTALAGAVTVSAGASRVTIPVGLIDDRTDEGAETVILTLTDSEGYTLGETQVHTLTITDNDTAGLRASPTTVHLAETGEQATVSVHLTSQPTAPVTVTFASSQGRVATVTPVALRFTPATWQTPQTVTVTAGADGVATLRGTVQSNDRGYAALASGALPPIRVRVGADLTGLTTPWLARFGRTVTSQAVTGVTARLSAARTPGLTGTVAGLALDRMGEKAAPATAQLAPALAPSDPRLNPGGQQLTLRDILAGSAFALTSDPSATGGSYALWGQGAWTHFAGQAGAQDVEGNVLSGTLGVDWAQGAWVLGVAVSHTQGDGDAAQTTAQGDLASSLTLVTPYVGVDVTEHLSLWGTMGYGRGTVGLTLPTEPEVETDTSLLLAAGGLRGRLLEPAPTGGLAVAVRSEARFLRTMADAETAHGLAEIEADVVLLRVGLESSWQQPLADGGAVVPRLDLGLRQDAGDAERGFGFEVQGGVRWEAPAHGLTLDLVGQTLLAHSDREFETWGGSATVQWAANPNSAAGPALTLRQTYGGTGTGGGAGSMAGANTFWTENPVALLQAPGPAELRLTADFGWGVPLQAGLGVPHVQYGWGPTSRDVTLGWRLLPTRGTDVTLELTATHREAVRTAPAQGVALSLNWTW